ncbi:MAG: response regulator transcription factor [Opitutaceae bacterium]|nr:response regulator transcription factor [Opitutaceae bacterium]
MKLRTLIVDDEFLARERLRGFLEAEPGVEIVAECANGNEAVDSIRRLTPDLLFLDVEMPGRNGLQVLMDLPENQRPAIIFATAHERFAIDAFDLSAVDYLLKPFDRDRFRQALRRAADFLQRSRGLSADAPRAAPDGATRIERITVKADGRLVFLRSDEIVRVEAADNYAILHLSGSRLMVRETLAALEVRLGGINFARVNRSALVHRDQIREIQPALHGDYTVVLRDGTKLPLSRSLRGQLDQFLT